MAGRVTFEKSRIITFSSLSEKEKESYMDFLVDNDVQVRGKTSRATAAWGSRAQYPQACCVPRWRVDGWLVCSCVEADVQSRPCPTCWCLACHRSPQFFKEKDGSFAANIRLCTAALAASNEAKTKEASGAGSRQRRRSGSRSSVGSQRSRQSRGSRRGSRARGVGAASSIADFNYSAYPKFWYVT